MTIPEDPVPVDPPEPEAVEIPEPSVLVEVPEPFIEDPPEHA